MNHPHFYTFGVAAHSAESVVAGDLTPIVSLATKSFYARRHGSVPSKELLTVKTCSRRVSFYNRTVATDSAGGGILGLSFRHFHVQKLDALDNSFGDILGLGGTVSSLDAWGGGGVHLC